MKKLFSAILCFALILTGVFAFAACKKSDAAVGKWTLVEETYTNGDFTQTYTGEELTAEMGAVVLELKSDKVAIMWTDEEKEYEGTYTFDGTNVKISYTDEHETAQEISGQIKDGKLTATIELGEGATVTMVFEKNK